MTGSVRAADALSAAVVVQRGGPVRRAARWLWVAVATLVFQDADVPLLPADVVVVRRTDGNELVRVKKATVFQAEELLAEVSQQLADLSVDEFCARWVAGWTDV